MILQLFIFDLKVRKCGHKNSISKLGFYISFFMNSHHDRATKTAMYKADIPIAS